MIWWVVILFAAGAGLITVEFVVPGGICGTAGALLIIVSAVMGCYHYPDYWPPILLLEFLGTICCVLLGIYLLPRSPFGKLLMLGDAQKADEGWVNETGNTELAGKTGTVVTPLRPAGTVEFGTERVQAVSEGAFIEAGAVVKVIEVHGNRIVVERAEPARINVDA
ncbi:MAG TPA: NfeD family protein [Candidatus Hydrogenedentes bacterium]|jgi:membrane-bound serine protease (ClpP class)|nr:NfeD family protein [Candidatus Hydrogenedentota bacterium]HPJ98148.1 NfeD family protein [Candidatus Hydrogenedentota bacterium]